MGAVLGICFALGLLLVVLGATRPPQQHAADRPRPKDLAGGLRRLAAPLLASVLVGAVTLVVTAIPMAALLAAGAAAAVPALLRRRASVRRRRAELAAWPDAIDHLLTAVRAGVPLAEAMCEVAVSGPAPLRAGFAVHTSTWRRGGSFGEGLRSMQRHFNDAAADRVVVSLGLAAEAGGDNVGKVLATQGDFLRSDLRMRAEIDAKQSWTVSAARVAVAAPWLAVAAVSVRTESARAFATPAGAAVLLATAVICALAYWAMTRIAALPQPSRLPELAK